MQWKNPKRDDKFDDLFFGKTVPCSSTWYTSCIPFNSFHFAQSTWLCLTFHTSQVSYRHIIPSLPSTLYAMQQSSAEIWNLFSYLLFSLISPESRYYFILFFMFLFCADSVSSVKIRSVACRIWYRQARFHRVHVLQPANTYIRAMYYMHSDSSPLILIQTHIHITHGHAGTPHIQTLPKTYFRLCMCVCVKVHKGNARHSNIYVFATTQTTKRSASPSKFVYLAKQNNKITNRLWI